MKGCLDLIAGSLVASLAVCACAGTCDVTVDFERECGTVRRLNGICNGLPLVMKSNPALNEQFAALEVAGIRFHDQASRNNGLALVDVSRIFPLAHADENDPRNYIFDQTDDYIAYCRTFTDAIEFRIGEQIEHFERHYRIRPPADYDKYARICLNIVRHYNEGWANGFRWNIRRWSIWEEPDNRRLFDGDYQKEYFPLYAKIAVALKSAYPHLKVGGPQTRGREMFRIEQFVSYCRDHKLPLDFCGVTDYRRSVDRFLEVGAETRRILDAHGYGKAEVELSEWHCEPVSWSARTPEQAKVYRESLTGMESAAFAAAVFAAGQDSAYDRMFFYATDIGSWAIFDFTLKTRHPVWSAFKAFADTARLQRRVETSADQKRGFYALATRGESGAGALMLTALRTSGTEPVRVRVKGGLVPGEVLLENGGDGRLVPADGWTFSGDILTLPAAGRNAIWFVGFGGCRARRLACDAPRPVEPTVRRMDFVREDGKFNFAFVVDARNRGLTAEPLKKFCDGCRFGMGEVPEVYGDDDNEKLAQVPWHVVFGDSASARRLGVGADTLKEGEFVVRSFDRGVLVVGKDAAANRKALARFSDLASRNQWKIPAVK